MEQEQQHPLAKSDRLLVDRLLLEEMNNYNLTEVARLRIRYHNFQGAQDIQRDLQLILQKWQLSEEDLFARTREIYASGSVHQNISPEEQQHWN